jgi:hypothetical protein
VCRQARADFGQPGVELCGAARVHRGKGAYHAAAARRHDQLYARHLEHGRGDHGQAQAARDVCGQAGGGHAGVPFWRVWSGLVAMVAAGWREIIKNDSYLRSPSKHKSLFLL